MLLVVLCRGIFLVLGRNRLRVAPSSNECSHCLQRKKPRERARCNISNGSYATVNYIWGSLCVQINHVVVSALYVVSCARSKCDRIFTLLFAATPPWPTLLKRETLQTPFPTAETRGFRNYCIVKDWTELNKTSEPLKTSIESLLQVRYIVPRGEFAVEVQQDKSDTTTICTGPYTTTRWIPQDSLLHRTVVIIKAQKER